MVNFLFPAMAHTGISISNPHNDSNKFFFKSSFPKILFHTS